MGKLSSEELKKLLQCIRKDQRVTVPPKIGYDAGVHKIGNDLLVVATDPCTGVPQEWFGWLLINYAASDVALFGAKPEFCTVNLLGPRLTKAEVFQEVMKQTCSAADELNIAIVRGHTGMYDSLSDLLGVCTVYGTIQQKNLITPGGAKPGDLILCTKPIGLETVTNFSVTHKEQAQKLFGLKQQEKLSKLVYMQSCVKEALQLAEEKGVHAMHDATEGGLVAALNELAQASNVGFTVEYEKIPIVEEARILQKKFGLSGEQVLAMSSTGTVLAAVDPQSLKEVKDVLYKAGLSAHLTGEFTKKGDRILVKEKKRTVFPETADDPYTMILENT